jgi:PIN domain nuclease of toxin-antitoxin system
MATVVYLDTHVVAWLYAGFVNRLSAAAKRAVSDNQPLVSPIVELELEFLHETGRTSKPAGVVLADLAHRIGLAVCERPFKPVARAACQQHWTRDPFDRIIVGHAESAQAELVTKDRTIRDHYSRALW